MESSLAPPLTGARLEERAVWNISSTAEGGGVAEMLQVLVGYTLGAGLNVHWLVMSGDPEFFVITKRIHNQLHGSPGDGRELGVADATHYSRVAAANAKSVLSFVQPGDVVLLHDPQSAGLAAPLAEAGVQVVWRCHVGDEQVNYWTEQAWSFLRPHLTACRAYVFSARASYRPWMEESMVWIIPPSIDPFSPKNEEIDNEGVLRTLRRIGLLAGGRGDAPAIFTRRDGTTGPGRTKGIDRLRRRCAALLLNVPLVVQVSRWDRLKDMTGVMKGFAARVAGRLDAQLALVGPIRTMRCPTTRRTPQYSGECLSAWNALPMSYVRRWIYLVTLPMDDIDENATMVNAIQRYATVIVQKSLAEGFGLTVTEAMWKSKAVIASDVGGIDDADSAGNRDPS